MVQQAYDGLVVGDAPVAPAPTPRRVSLRPLDGLSSIRLKLAVLVTVSVLLAAVLPAAGIALGLPAVLTIPVSVLLVLLLTQLLARGMTSPLREMTAAAQAMATGDYSVRVRDTSLDEVGELARAFNTMAADLERVERQRRDLVSTVSQELTTPVAALRAMLENLVDGMVRPDATKLQTALDQTERLTGLVANLLDLSRLDAGLAQLDAQTLAVRPFLQDVVEEAREAGYPVRYQVTVDPFDLVVRADRARLKQLVTHLLDNAGRHSPPDGVVRVRALRGEHRRILLEVSDNGPGIAPGERSAVFERFSVGTGAGVPQDGGTGIGLAIARWVTDLHGGSIEVLDSPSGCRIRATLPEQGPVAAAVAAVVEQSGVDQPAAADQPR